ncbi:MAG: peptide chain release factor N(5)-glutamine methyltransferase [Verrucomicrobiota bacterium]
MKLLKILTESAEWLAKKGVESPRLQAELLLGHVLGMERLKLYLKFEREVTEKELEALRPLLKRRSHREPIQHILGETNFCGLHLKCSPAALIPRPETEMLVELAVEKLKNVPSGLIYDVGTGTGAVALALAQKLPEWRFIATDISKDALALAHENHKKYFEAKIEWVETSLLYGQTEKAEAVVANLPYLTTEEMSSLPPEVLMDPKSALHGGVDGLDWIRQLIPQAVKLAPKLFLEIGPAQAEEIQKILQEMEYSQVIIKEDFTERRRFIFAEKECF